jgi:hypothetical protein
MPPSTRLPAQDNEEEVWARSHRPSGHRPALDAEDSALLLMQMQMHYSLGIIYCTRIKACTVYDRVSVFCIGKMQPLIGVSLSC